MIEQASKPELQAEQSVQEGQPAVFKCSVRHTCPSYQPTLSWNHDGNTIMSYKDIGHGNWEAESVLTFTPTKEDDHSSISCTVRHHGNVKGEIIATQPIFVKEQPTLNHILIPVISGLGAALLVGLLCFFIVKRYKKRNVANPEMTMDRLPGFIQVKATVVQVAESRDQDTTASNAFFRNKSVQNISSGGNILNLKHVLDNRREIDLFYDLSMKV